MLDISSAAFECSFLVITPSLSESSFSNFGRTSRFGIGSLAVRELCLTPFPEKKQPEREHATSKTSTDLIRMENALPVQISQLICIRPKT